MNKKLILPTILFVIVLIVAFFILAKNKNIDSQIILYYGKECPHCKIVEEFINQNNIQEKISFIQKDVFHDQINAKEMTEKAKICNMPTDSIGVPFLWDGSKCIIGDQDIINFFKQKIAGK